MVKVNESYSKKRAHVNATNSRPAWSKENKHCTILNTFKLGCFPCRLTCFWSILLSCKHCCTNRIDTHKTLSTLQVGPELYNHIYISQYEISTTPWNAILRSKTPSRLKQRFCFLRSLSSQRVSAHCATVPSSLQRTQMAKSIIPWWFQPTWKNMSQIEHPPPTRGENNKFLERFESTTWKHSKIQWFFLNRLKLELICFI